MILKEHRYRTAGRPPDVNDVVDVMALDREGLERFAVEHDQPAFRGRQLFKWLFGKGARTFDEMTDLPLDFRRRLADVARITRMEPVDLRTSSDLTVKALFTLPTGRKVEAVLIPDVAPDGSARRLTVCVSSQVGCAMACSFCATGLMGFQQNLTSGEIFDQAWAMNGLGIERFGRRVTNVVYMGMGEPLLNYGPVLRSIDLLTDPDALGLAPRRITLSTVGLARRIKDFADEDRGVNLAVSLHAPSEAQRSSIMPVNRAAATDLAALREALTYYHAKTGRPVTYEYCMFRGFNDSREDAERLARVVGWVPSKVNLIMYNPVEGLDFERTPEDRLNAFIRVLVQNDVTVTVRRSRGQDVDAACGQLAVKSA